MKVRYRGFEIDVYRDKCLGGWDMLYYSVFELDHDGQPRIERVTDFTTGEDSVREYIGYMKNRIDSELAAVEPWT